MMIPCPRCKRFYRIKHNGHAFEEGMPAGASPDGVTHWQPYKLWIGDLYECEGCGAQVIVGMARAPLAEHYQPVYAEMAARYHGQDGGLVRVDDCPGSFSQDRADTLQGRTPSSNPDDITNPRAPSGMWPDLREEDRPADAHFQTDFSQVERDAANLRRKREREEALRQPEDLDE